VGASVRQQEVMKKNTKTMRAGVPGRTSKRSPTAAQNKLPRRVMRLLHELAVLTDDSIDYCDPSLLGSFRDDAVAILAARRKASRK
jgi:hypothetical protein